MQKLVAVALLFCGNALYAQNTHPVNKDSTRVITPAYNSKIAATGDLYYGIEHVGHHPRMNGFAYFESNEWQAGTVTHNNVLYKDVLLKYDLLTDDLVVMHPNNFFAVTLVKERVQSFTIGNQEFIYIPETNSLGLKQAGFYHMMVTGKLSVLAKRSKLVEEKTSVGEVERTVISKEQFFAVKDGRAHPVTNEESVLGLLGEQGRKIRAHLKSREIKFRKHKEVALTEIATYYNQSAQ